MRTSVANEQDEVARLFLVGPRRPWDVYDRTAAYGWISVGRVYSVRDSNLGRAFLVGALGDGTAPVSLSGPENRRAAAEFLSRQFRGRFPGLDKSEGVAQFLKDITLGLYAQIADARFLKSQKRDGGLQGWLKGREKDPAVFEALCSGVRAREDKNEWQLEFNVFNTGGGVDRLKVSGSIAPLAIQALSVEEVKAVGEFYYPLEG
jgi:hypothetical protein